MPPFEVEDPMSLLEDTEDIIRQELRRHDEEQREMDSFLEEEMALMDARTFIDHEIPKLRPCSNESSASS
eukprot:CAMPEP_0119323896 /NCGR_PEP_ID=MMETSP1333-20130426/61899_1 /TAXON_ID=418940 /ORGANISM="Scyphosphaera apsteinii, Strain RCC1455" /LENGTH=69 /DNA_ID=CAMNT_0007331463 /DNA_START=43 /DNA_END=252 /DNA_ORIENTATION=+